jgi:hypothetical protein
VVTVTGSHFTGASAVTFGSVAASSFTVLNDTTLLATDPAEAAATVDIEVTTPSGTSSAVSGDHFTYSTASVPTVSAITPTSGSIAGGTVVYVSGGHFTGATGVSFGATAATSFTVLSDTLLTATAPAEATGTVDITVTSYAGTSSTGSADQFTYTSPQEAAGGAVALRPGAVLLTPALLGPVEAEAVVLWAAAGLDAAQLSVLRTAPVQIVDLPAPYLGLTGAGVIQLDRDAAGYGWFVDPTPATAEEFQAAPGQEGLVALVGSQAAGRMDLLTVVAHEMGHLLGLPDVPEAQAPGDLMDQTLEPGVRRLPSHVDALATDPLLVTSEPGDAIAQTTLPLTQGMPGGERVVSRVSSPVTPVARLSSTAPLALLLEGLGRGVSGSGEATVRPSAHADPSGAEAALQPAVLAEARPARAPAAVASFPGQTADLRALEALFTLVGSDPSALGTSTLEV